MRGLADALFTSEGTRARTAKVAALGAALAEVFARTPAQLPFATRLLTGTMLPTEDERTLGTGGRLLFEAAMNVTGMAAEDLGARARKNGDLGTAVGEAVESAIAAGRLAPGGLPLVQAEALALALAGTGSRAAKLEALEAALRACSPVEARYLTRAVLGEMRVGAKEGIVEDAIAKGFGRPLADVRRAAGLVADVGVLATLAAEDRLAEARVVVGRPVGFMLATPIESARGADLTAPHLVEDKIDGIRAQAHVAPDGVRLFARGKGPVTTAFPDVAAPLLDAVTRGVVTRAILDGEIVVFGDDGRPRPFSAIQPRLKKTEPDEELLRDHPVAYLVYDLLFEGDEPTLGLPFAERRARLERWAANAPAPVLLNGARPLLTPESLDAEFDGARQRGHEGLVLKRLDAPYAAGVRGFAWLKVKKALATLDVVVVAAERGHGRRAAVLSDLTFAVRNGDELLTVGKAYSGLTDEEIRTMTARLETLAVDVEKRGYLKVRPEIVIEVAFDGLQRSQRHSSGFALRFPRIAHVRDDKKPEDADTLDAVEALWEAQLASGHREDLTAKDRKKAPKKRGKKSGYRPDVRAKTKQLKLFED
ncbi:MAG: ATP-dependent ligase [Labilithrix sp.]|nr:ATP-dependent ligase [Labilithrix sp.]